MTFELSTAWNGFTPSTIPVSIIMQTEMWAHAVAAMDLIVEQQGAATQPQHAVPKDPLWPLLQPSSYCNETGLSGQAAWARMGA